MFKTIIILLGGLLLLAACSKSPENAKQKIETAKVFSVDEILNDNFEYNNQMIEIKGLCVHVCSHSGKKMFISGKSPEAKLQIFTSDKINSFDKKFEGSNLQVTGLLEEEKITAEDLDALEAETEANKSSETCDFESEMKKIKDLKSRITKSKKGYISKYTMSGVKVKVI